MTKELLFIRMPEARVDNKRVKKLHLVEYPKWSHKRKFYPCTFYTLSSLKNKFHSKPNVWALKIGAWKNSRKVLFVSIVEFFAVL